MIAPSAAARASRCGCGTADCRRECEGEFADGARLGVADGGSGGLADCVDRGFGFFAEADDEESLGFQSGRGMQEHGFVGAGLVFAGGEDGSCGGADGSSPVSRTGWGLASGPLAVWVSTAVTASSSVSIWARGEKERSVRIQGHYFIAAR